MKITKQVLRPERLRQVPEQFSWVDQALVQCGFIDRCDARAAALYLFLVTVADAQGLSYYGSATLAARLHLSMEELGAARAQLIAIDLIAYRTPLYQVLSLTRGAASRPPRAGAAAPTPIHNPVRNPGAGPVSLAHLIEQAELRRAGL
jgi:hypothetical protein